MAIDPARLAEIERLLAIGEGVREIQRQTGACRALIGQIRRGEYSIREIEEKPLVPGTAYRCKCGHRVVFRPCVICQALKAREQNPSTRNERKPCSQGTSKQ